MPESDVGQVLDELIKKMSAQSKALLKEAEEAEEEVEEMDKNIKTVEQELREVEGED